LVEDAPSPRIQDYDPLVVRVSTEEDFAIAKMLHSAWQHLDEPLYQVANRLAELGLALPELEWSPEVQCHCKLCALEAAIALRETKYGKQDGKWAGH